MQRRDRAPGKTVGATTSATSPFTLHQGAGALGVHSMTAYRYVRHGRLEAREDTGIWQVVPAAIDRLHGPTVCRRADC